MLLLLVIAFALLETQVSKNHEVRLQIVTEYTGGGCFAFIF